MALLNRSFLPFTLPLPTAAAPRGNQSLFSHCGNPRCSTGWLQLWRSRRHPLFEGRWACSYGCMMELVAAAVRRELAAGGAAQPPREHRLPLGLLLIEQGHLSPEQLRAALAERAAVAAETRLGEWLVATGLLSEDTVAHALGAQWGGPVFSLANYRPEDAASALPRLLAEAAGALPVRLVGGKLLYLAFAGRIDRSLSYGLERMLGHRVIAGVAPDSEFAEARARYLTAPAPAVTLVEAAHTAALAASVARLIERKKPEDARIVRIHDIFWVRMGRRAASRGSIGSGPEEDLLATVDGKFAESC